MKKITEPTFTMTPNVIFELLPEMDPAELRLIMVITRETFGWHRDSEVLSLSRLSRLSGLSRQGVINGIEKLLARDLIAKEPAGDSFRYRLLVNSIDYPSQFSRPELVNSVDQSQSTELTHINKGKEKKEKEVVGGADSSKKKSRRTYPVAEPDGRNPAWESLQSICEIPSDLLAVTPALGARLERVLNAIWKISVGRKYTWTAVQFGKAIKGFRAWWDDNDWRGKKGEAPKPESVQESWPKYEEFRRSQIKLNKLERAAS